MKFGKDYRNQKVPEWTDAYLDYDGLKEILLQIEKHKQSQEPPIHMTALHQRFRLLRTFSGLHSRTKANNRSGDIEDQVINVSRLPRDDTGHFYRTDVLRPLEEGSEEHEVLFFRKLDENLNKVNTFYKEKVSSVMQEAVELNKQMDALVALRIKVMGSHPSVEIAVAMKSARSSTAGAKYSITAANQTQENRETRDEEDYKLAGQENMESRGEEEDKLAAQKNIESRGEEDDKLAAQENMDSRGEEDDKLASQEKMESRGEEDDKLAAQENMESRGEEAHSIDTIRVEDPESDDDQEKSPIATTSNSRVENISKYNEDTLEILERAKLKNTLENPLSTLKGVFKESKDEDLRFKKVELKKVELRLKAVFVEFYQKLLLIKHYSFINLAAFSKIMKKYEKITSRRAARAYLENVESSYLGSSDEVNGLLKRVEATFVDHFANSDRRKGMKVLRPKTRREKHRVTFISGFLSGCSVALLCAIILLVRAKNVLNKEGGALYMVNIFQLYSVFAYAVLHMLLYAGNLYLWRRYRVNYPFIIGLKQGTELGYKEVFLLCSALAVLALASFLANLHLDFESTTQSYRRLTELVPLIPSIVFLLVLFCPFDIMYRSSRLFFLKAFYHCICAPLYKVKLPDFFLADNLTSQVQAIRNLELYMCYYGLGEHSKRENKCHAHGAYNAFYFIAALIPYWIRFLQCVRRLYEEEDSMHGYNGLKYFLIIVTVIVRTAFEFKKGTTLLVLALLSSAAATAFCTYWDLVMDWGLLRRKSRNPFLRDKLVISHNSVYFIAMVLNVALRLAWMEQVLVFKLQSVHKTTVTNIVAVLEIIRRGVWNFFRLENEHLNNCGKYRAFKTVPLPFSVYENGGKED